MVELIWGDVARILLHDDPADFPVEYVTARAASLTEDSLRAAQAPDARQPPGA
jgi:hypothetical protein